MSFPAPAFVNVRVTVTPGSQAGQYAIACFPDPVPVTQRTVINFYMDPDSAPIDVIFTDKIIKKPDHTRQFSLPSVSTDGKMLTLSDVDTVRETVHITLHVTDKDHRKIPFDPQIVNGPTR